MACCLKKRFLSGRCKRHHQPDLFIPLQKDFQWEKGQGTWEWISALPKTMIDAPGSGVILPANTAGFTDCAADTNIGLSGLCLDPQLTNILDDPDDLATANWDKINVTVSAKNITDRYGQANEAQRITPGAGASRYLHQANAASVDDRWACFQIDLRAPSGTHEARIQMRDTVLGENEQANFALSQNWRRCFIYKKFSAGAGNLRLLVWPDPVNNTHPVEARMPWAHNIARDVCNTVEGSISDEQARVTVPPGKIHGSGFGFSLWIYSNGGCSAVNSQYLALNQAALEYFRVRRVSSTMYLEVRNGAGTTQASGDCSSVFNMRAWNNIRGYFTAAGARLWVNDLEVGNASPFNILDHNLPAAAYIALSGSASGILRHVKFFKAHKCSAETMDYVFSSERGNYGV